MLDRGVFGAVCVLVIVDHDNTVGFGWPVQGWVILHQERAQRDVVELDTRVSLDEATVKIWSDEDISQQEDTKENTEDDADGLAGAELLQRWRGGSLDDHEQGQNSAGEGEVEGDCQHTESEGIAAFQDSEFDGGEDDGGETTGQKGGNDPTGGDL